MQMKCALCICILILFPLLSGCGKRAAAELSDEASLPGTTEKDTEHTAEPAPENAALDKTETKKPEPLPEPSSKSEADDYFFGNGKVYDVIDAVTSQDVPDERQASELLHDRGFTEMPVTYDYSMDGRYLGEKEADSESSERHPMYQTFYISKSSEVWTVFIVNGRVYANPVSFNEQSDLQAQLIVSESGMIMSYDSEGGRFYLTEPNGTALIVKTVDRIDAEMLDVLTVEEIKKR